MFGTFMPKQHLFSLHDSNHERRGEPIRDKYEKRWELQIMRTNCRYSVPLFASLSNIFTYFTCISNKYKYNKTYLLKLLLQNIFAVSYISSSTALRLVTYTMLPQATITLALAFSTTSAAAATINKRIIGGEDANQGEFRSVVSIQMGAFCGGTLLNKYTVLTAAHCVEEAGRNTIVKAGTAVSLPSPVH